MKGRAVCATASLVCTGTLLLLVALVIYLSVQPRGHRLGPWLVAGLGIGGLGVVVEVGLCIGALYDVYFSNLSSPSKRNWYQALLFANAVATPVYWLSFRRGRP